MKYKNKKKPAFFPDRTAHKKRSRKVYHIDFKSNIKQDITFIIFFNILFYFLSYIYYLNPVYTENPNNIRNSYSNPFDLHCIEQDEFYWKSTILNLFNIFSFLNIFMAIFALNPRKILNLLPNYFSEYVENFLLFLSFNKKMQLEKPINLEDGIIIKTYIHRLTYIAAKMPWLWPVYTSIKNNYDNLRDFINRFFYHNDSDIHGSGMMTQGMLHIFAGFVTLISESLSQRDSFRENEIEFLQKKQIPKIDSMYYDYKLSRIFLIANRSLLLIKVTVNQKCTEIINVELLKSICSQLNLIMIESNEDDSVYFCIKFPEYQKREEVSSYIEKVISNLFAEFKRIESILESKEKIQNILKMSFLRQGDCNVITDNQDFLRVYYTIELAQDSIGAQNIITLLSKNGCDTKNIESDENDRKIIFINPSLKQVKKIENIADRNQFFRVDNPSQVHNLAPPGTVAILPAAVAVFPENNDNFERKQSLGQGRNNNLARLLAIFRLSTLELSSVRIEDSYNEEKISEEDIENNLAEGKPFLITFTSKNKSKYSILFNTVDDYPNLSKDQARELISDLESGSGIDIKKLQGYSCLYEIRLHSNNNKYRIILYNGKNTNGIFIAYGIYTHEEISRLNEKQISDKSIEKLSDYNTQVSRTASVGL